MLEPHWPPSTVEIGSSRFSDRSSDFYKIRWKSSSGQYLTLSSIVCKGEHTTAYV